MAKSPSLYYHSPNIYHLPSIEEVVGSSPARLLQSRMEHMPFSYFSLRLKKRTSLNLYSSVLFIFVTLGDRNILKASTDILHQTCGNFAQNSYLAKLASCSLFYHGSRNCQKWPPAHFLLWQRH